MALGLATLLALRFIAIGFSFQSAHIQLLIYVISGIIALVIAIGIPCKERVSYWGHLATVLLIDNLLGAIIILFLSFLGAINPIVWTGTVLTLTVLGANLFWKRMQIGTNSDNMTKII